MPQLPSARRVSLTCGGWLNVHEQRGRGPAVVLIHGFTDCAESFRLVLRDLSDCHLLIPDLRGHGASFRGAIHGLETLTGDLEEVLMRLGLSRVVVVGHSMGALVAINLAARGRITVIGLATISGSLRPGGPSLRALKAQMQALPEPVPFQHPFWETWYACRRAVPQGFLDRLRLSCIAMRREDWLACLTLLETVDLRSMAEALRIPALVLSGVGDEIFPPSHHAEMVEHLTPLTSRSIDDVGHNPHWESPHLVAADLRGFLETLKLPN